MAAEAVTAGRALLTPWRAQLERSLKKNKHLAYSRYVQLATVREGRPANRTVVFRGFLDQASDALTFVTDSRSRKVQEVAANPAAEVAWYFPDTREQYRIAGDLRVVDALCADGALQQARRRIWSSMSEGGRQQFGWPHPGRPRAQEEPGAWSRPAAAAQDPPLDTFCLVVLQVEEVERLLLFSNERYQFRKQAGADGAVTWTEESINP